MNHSSDLAVVEQHPLSLFQSSEDVRHGAGHGTGFGHLAVSVPDIYGACEKMKAEGVSIPRPPGPMKHGTTVIAFIEDPDGYKIELIERK